jgi:uncharacterized protein
MRGRRAESGAHKNALVLCALLSALCALKTLALDVPPAPDHWFTDRASLVSSDQATQLNQKLQAFEQKSGAQFIVYVFPSLEGEPLEDFTIHCAEKWKVGQKKYDNGLILFVFAQERKLRFEVGYGLEGSVTDAFSSITINDVIKPRFQANDYYGGLNAAIDAVDAKITKGEEPVPAMQRSGARGGQRNDINPIFVLAILFVVFFVILPMLSRRRSGCGGCFPLFFFPGGGSGITFGGGGGGFSGGGFGGGGGFSGGGGSFGGGGASGGW